MISTKTRGYVALYATVGMGMLLLASVLFVSKQSLSNRGLTTRNVESYYSQYYAESCVELALLDLYKSQVAQSGEYAGSEGFCTYDISENGNGYEISAIGTGGESEVQKTLTVLVEIADVITIVSWD